MPSISCGAKLKNREYSCVKNITATTAWLWILPMIVHINNYLTQFMSYLYTAIKDVITLYFSPIMHTKHSPNNKYNLKIYLYLLLSKRKETI